MSGDWWHADPIASPSKSDDWWKADPHVSATDQPPPMSWGEVGSQAIANAPGSAWNFGKDLIQPFRHPIDTATGLYKVGEGALEKAGVISGKDEIPYADAVGNYYKDRYGSVEGFKHALASDPVGVAGDVSIPLTLGGEGLARAPGIVGKVGEIARVTGEAVNPLMAPTKAAKAAVEIAKPIVRFGQAAVSPETEAAKQVAEALARDAGKGLSPAEADAARLAGQPVAVMDTGGQTTLRLARRAANFSPEAQETFGNAIGARYRTQSERLGDWLNSTFNYPNSDETQKALDEVARKVNRPAYAKAYSDGAKGLWGEDLAQISQAPVVQDAIRKTMVSAKNEAAKMGFAAPSNPFRTDARGRIFLGKDYDGNILKPNLQFWDYVKRNLDKAGTRESKDWARVLRDHLDGLVPSYAEARGGAAKFFGAEDALEAGQITVNSRLNNRQIAAGLAKMSPVERKLFQDGFVDRFIQDVREASYSRNILDKINSSPAARDRIVMAIGPDKTKELEAYLRVEGIMDRARKAMGNSTTAQQTHDMRVGVLDLFDAKQLIAKVFRGAARAAGRGIDEKVAEKMGEMLTSRDPKDFHRGIKAIAKSSSLMNAIRNPIPAAGDVAARGAALTYDSSAQPAGAN